MHFLQARFGLIYSLLRKLNEDVKSQKLKFLIHPSTKSFKNFKNPKKEENQVKTTLYFGIWIDFFGEKASFMKSCVISQRRIFYKYVGKFVRDFQKQIRKITNKEYKGHKFGDEKVKLRVSGLKVKR